MGLSVTAASVIFFVAILTAGSAAMNVYWDSARGTTEARDGWARMSASQVSTSLTISVDQCTSGCNAGTAQVRIDITNGGTTVVDYRNITYLIDGIAHTVANTTLAQIVLPSTVSNTDLILPGETMRVTLPDVVLTATYSTSTLPVQVVTLDGVFGRR